MLPDLTSIFTAYEGLRGQIDKAFGQVQERCGGLVACKKGCSDCCHALFDLSLVEAMYLNRAFQQKFDFGAERSAIIERADEVDRKLARIKRDFFREEKSGVDALSIMKEAAGARMRCPLLGEDNMCILYDARPITCRAYGVPTSIAGEGHVCGFSGFSNGTQYPTLRLDKVQAALDDMSLAIEKACKSRYDKLHEIYMPLSMALLTNFDEDFLGIGEEKPEK